MRWPGSLQRMVRPPRRLHDQTVAQPGANGRARRAAQGASRGASLSEQTWRTRLHRWHHRKVTLAELRHHRREPCRVGLADDSATVFPRRPSAPETRNGRSGLTTQAQRPGPRGRWIATATRGPGSLQRMVRPSRRLHDQTVAQPGANGRARRAAQGASRGASLSEQTWRTRLHRGHHRKVTLAEPRHHWREPCGVGLADDSATVFPRRPSAPQTPNGRSGLTVKSATIYC